MLSNDQLGVNFGHSAMSAQCPHCPKADVDPRNVMSQKCRFLTYATQQRSRADYNNLFDHPSAPSRGSGTGWSIALAGLHVDDQLEQISARRGGQLIANRLEHRC
jgi:hypothetical protein